MVGVREGINSDSFSAEEKVKAVKNTDTTNNPYLSHYVHGCRRFRKFGDYWLSQFKVHPSKEKMDMACEHYAKRYPDAIVKVFKVRCHGRSWVYGVYWIHPQQMKQQDKERKDAETFSSEEKVKAVKNGREYGDIGSYSYKGNLGVLNWDVDREQKGLIKFKNNFKDGHMGDGDFLPHANKFQPYNLKRSHAKNIFRLILDRKCQTCKEPIHKKGCGSCAWCEQNWETPKFDSNGFYDDEWFKNLKVSQQDEYIHDMATTNPYCRDCLYWLSGTSDKTYPTSFDKESANYSLGNSLCGEHWEELVNVGEIPKEAQRYSLYQIENTNPYEIMLKRRLRMEAEGSVAESFSASSSKPKLSPKQYEYLNNIKAYYSDGSGYAYVEVSSHGWKPYKPNIIRNLLEKEVIALIIAGKGSVGEKIITGREAGWKIESEGAYLIKPTAIAAEYPFSKGDMTGYAGHPIEDEWIKTQKQKTPPIAKTVSVSDTGYKISAREYFEKHNVDKNEHKYYAFFTITTKGNKSYWAFYGRLPGYERGSSLALLEMEDWNRYEVGIAKRYKTYSYIGATIPPELEVNAIQKINEKYPSMRIGMVAIDEDEEEEMKDENAGLNAYELMLKRRMGMGAEGYTPTNYKQKWIKYIEEPFEINDYYYVPMKYPLPNYPTDPEEEIKRVLDETENDDGSVCAWVQIKEFTVVDDKVLIVNFKYRFHKWNRDKEQYDYYGNKESWGSIFYSCNLPYTIIQKNWDDFRPKWIEWFKKKELALQKGHSVKIAQLFANAEPKFNDYFSRDNDESWRFNKLLGDGYGGGGLKKKDLRIIAIDDAFEFLEKMKFYNNPYEKIMKRRMKREAESFNPKSYLLYGGLVALAGLALFKRKR